MELTAESLDKLKWQHEMFLYPIVRVFAEKSAGSGTVIYSKVDPKTADEYQTFILTNHHVVDDLITYKDEWDSVLKKNRKREILNHPKIEVFSYVRTSEVDSSNRYNAEIVAYSKEHDLAILKVDSPSKFQYVAKLLPQEQIKNLKLFMGVVVAGCSLAHEPFCNFGQITFLKEIIEQKDYIMTNASSVFGNSGGALFLRDTGEMIGVPSRISSIQLGFGYDVITWMGFSAHPKRLYEFIKEQSLHFLIDETDTYYAAVERRKKKEKEALGIKDLVETAGAKERKWDYDEDPNLGGV